MVISLAVAAGVLGLAAHMALGQLRFYRGMADVTAVRMQLDHASGIVTSLLWGTSPKSGDIIAALDTALELRVTLGTAVTCESSPGRITIPAATSSRGNSMGAYVESPEPGDHIAAFLDDSLPGWIALRVSSFPARGGGCALFPTVAETWTLDLVEQIALPPGTALRFTRPLRLSFYRGSDGQWFLGARDWNGMTQRFNTIQPVAGPLRPYDGDVEKTGLLFSYFGSDGTPLNTPAEPARIAGVRVVTHGLSARAVQTPGITTDPGARYSDSKVVSVAFRNAK